MRAGLPLLSGLRWQPPVHSPMSAGALSAGWRVAVQGSDPRVELAHLLSGHYAAEGVTLCASGTDALTRAIREATSELARRQGEGVVVALPAYGCYDLATAAVGAGSPVVLYDLDPRTLGPDPDSLRRALSEGARVVVCAPLYGLPIDWEMVSELAEERGALVIEDAAQGQGGGWRGRPLGSLGSWSVLSFGRGKGWTGGRGGALLRRSGVGAIPGGGVEDPIAAPSNLRTVAMATVQWALARPALYGLPASVPWLGLGETRYLQPARPGELPSAAAAILLATHEEALAAAVRRRRVAMELGSRLRDNDNVMPARVVDGGSPGFLRFPLRLPGFGRSLVDSSPARRLGIGAGYPGPLSRLGPLRRQLVRGIERYPGAEELVRDLIVLPTHAHLTSKDLDRLVRFLGQTPLGRHGGSQFSEHDPR